MRCYRCNEMMNSGAGIVYECPECGLSGEMDTSDSMRTFTWGFLDVEPPCPKEDWDSLPPSEWDGGRAPGLAIKIARFARSAGFNPTVAQLPALGWCVITEGLLEIPLRWQKSRKTVIVWSEQTPEP